MLFSQRKGIKPLNKVIQIDTIDGELRNGLWNALDVMVWGQYKTKPHPYTSFKYSNLYPLFIQYWLTLLKIPIDNMPSDFRDAKDLIRDYFYKCEWHEVYDLIDFTATNCEVRIADQFTVFCNDILEKENSAYRFINYQLTQITDTQEIESIVEAFNNTDKYSGAKIHLTTALNYLSDRMNPDFRNSIKESISAVEAIAIIISNIEKATLGDALNELEKVKKFIRHLKKVLVHFMAIQAIPME